MCHGNIFGVMYPQANVPLRTLPRFQEYEDIAHIKALSVLAEHNTGMESQFGYFALSDYLKFVRKFNKPFTIDSVTMLPIQSIIVQTRVALVEYKNDDTALNTYRIMREITPLEGRKTVLMHRGSLEEYDTPMTRQYRTNASNTDTSFLHGMLEHYLARDRFADAIANARNDNASTDTSYITAHQIATVVEQFKGSQACVMYDNRTGYYYTWRVNSSLYTGINRETNCFSISSTKIDGICEFPVPQGHVFRICPSHGVILPLASFDYISDYDEVEHELTHRPVQPQPPAYLK